MRWSMRFTGCGTRRSCRPWRRTISTSSDVPKLAGAEAEWARTFFQNEVFPVLTPLAVDASHPFPQVLNKSHNLIVRARKPGNEDPLYAVVQVPRVIPRFIPLPREKGEAEPVELHLPGLTDQGARERNYSPAWNSRTCDAFRITRNSDLYIDEEEAENLLRSIEQELRRSSRGNVVRLEVEADCPEDFQEWLLERFKLKEADLYKVCRPADDDPPAAADRQRGVREAQGPPIHPGLRSRTCRRTETCGNCCAGRMCCCIIRTSPSTASWTWSRSAATDPQVLAIKMTLYRTSGDSAIVKALINAAQNGKQVVALVELKARFDEANNIHWARALEEAGAHVVYGLVGLKTHCKALLIVRRDEDRIRHYAHLGTGNYHPRTARIYTDLSLFTTEPELTQEVATLFNTLTGLASYPGFKKLMVAPFDLGRRVRELIERERDHARAGRPGAHHREDQLAGG